MGQDAKEFLYSGLETSVNWVGLCENTAKLFRKEEGAGGQAPIFNNVCTVAGSKETAKRILWRRRSVPSCPSAHLNPGSSYSSVTILGGYSRDVMQAVYLLHHHGATCCFSFRALYMKIIVASWF